jgi:potassium efflux system protein
LTASLNGWWFMLLLIALMLSFCPRSTTAAPKTKEQNPSLMEYLVQEKTQLSIDINKEKQFSSPKNEEDFKAQLKQIDSSLVIIDAKIESLNSFLDNQKKREQELNQRLKHIQQLPLAGEVIATQERVAKIETLQTINNKTIDLINENLNLAKQLRILLSDEIKTLNSWKERFDLDQKISLIKLKKEKLYAALQSLYQKNIQVEPQSQSSQNPKNQNEYQSIRLLNNQQITLLHSQINALNLQKNELKTEISLLTNPDIKSIQFAVDVYKDSFSQCIQLEKSLLQLQTSLDKEAIFFTHKPLKESLVLVQTTLKQHQKELKTQKDHTLKALDAHQNQLKKLISSRQSLSEYNINSWPLILKKLTGVPNQLYLYVKTLSLKVYDSYGWLDLTPVIILWTLLFILISLFFVSYRFLKVKRDYREQSRLAGYLYYGLRVILQQTLLPLFVVAGLCLIFRVTKISFANYQLLINLMAVWLTFKTLILIARMVLLERISDASGKDVKLYYRLKWLFIFGGWATALMVLGFQLSLAVILRDMFNRLFMLFLLTFAVVMWKSREIIPYLLKPLLTGKKRYIQNIVSLMIILIPLTLFTTAAIGLSGFINLAWTMSGYQADILLIIVGYILARGLLFDALELLSEWMISSLDHGWLWIEVFLKPFDKILRIALLLCGFWILFFVLGWSSDSMVMVTLGKFAQYSIINFTGVHVTVTSVIEFLVVLSIFIWTIQWTREFCYRWLYTNIKDVGVRNSLSVFTQYTVILVGGFVTLHVLGLDLGGMTMILGGLAVGMGFGLRDFASNIVGGLMLLIERPVREGDLITLGEHEGRVAHIGIRAMRVSSWDNMEVLIPNAETFNKPFTNWTLQDSIVRTVIPIKVCRSDDPEMVQQLIIAVLATIPEIVSDPSAQVFLMNIDEALIEFEVRYFINVQIYTRVEVRSKVLFAITEQFKASGIRPPIEPVSVELKGGCSEFFNQSSTTA